MTLPNVSSTPQERAWLNKVERVVKLGGNLKRELDKACNQDFSEACWLRVIKKIALRQGKSTTCTEMLNTVAQHPALPVIPDDQREALLLYLIEGRNMSALPCLAQMGYRLSLTEKQNKAIVAVMHNHHTWPYLHHVCPDILRDPIMQPVVLDAVSKFEFLIQPRNARGFARLPKTPEDTHIVSTWVGERFGKRILTATPTEMMGVRRSFGILIESNSLNASAASLAGQSNPGHQELGKLLREVERDLIEHSTLHSKGSMRVRRM